MTDYILGQQYYQGKEILLAGTKEGEILLEVQADGAVTGICESASGEIILRISDTEKFVNGLAILDTETGTVGKIHWLKDITYCIAKGYAKDVLIVDVKVRNPYALIEKGVIEELTLYIKESGMEETPSCLFMIG